MFHVDRITAIAEGLFAIAKSEGNLEETEDELFRFARVVEGNDDLQSALSDPHIPAARRQQIVEDLLEGKASEVTVALASLIVGLGRGHDLPKIVDQLVDFSAADRSQAVAEVRSAVALSDAQVERLAGVLSEATGRSISVKNVVDPSVMGGIVTTIGDQVIDGSVRSRLNQLKEAF
ncbi:MAG: ATP synthase subunit b-delta [Acidimicrobiales bacterium]|nr:MAG: ATP synthase F1 subunit delta [Actinomycetota bacterium]MBV6508920.1 ATP synthase subunit b-delta [Acidimicrobiales bacterium]RIK03058.1 MAG: ATP synthase F1 subunit delta [Acidobacteriota bacterium]